MGRVFSLEQIADSDNHVPTMDDFEYALGMFHDSVHREVEAGIIDGAFVFGSVAIGMFNQRSDFDCMIVPVEHSVEGAGAIRRITNSINPSGRLEIGAIAHAKQRLISGRHEMDRYFGQHLRGKSRIVFGNDPEKYMQFPEYPASDTVLQYIRHKKRSVTEGFSAQGEACYKGLQRILELPLAVGRKALRGIDEVNGTSISTDDSANKSLVAPLVLDFFDGLGIGEIPRTILQLDRTYTKDVLPQVLEGSIRLQEYDDYLDEIASTGIAASNWLDILDDRLVKLLA